MAEKPKRLYDIVKVEGPPDTSSGSMGLERALDAEDREKVKELQRMRLDEAILDRELRVKEKRAKLEGGGGTTVSGGGTSTAGSDLAAALIRDPKAQEQWLALSEDQRSTIIQSTQMLAMGGTVGAGGMGGMLPLMLLMSRTNPGMDAKGMVELIKVVSPPQTNQGLTAEGVIKIVEAVKPKDAGESSTLRTVLDGLMGEVKSLREQVVGQSMAKLELQIAELGKRPGMIDELASKKTELSALREIFGGGAGATSIDFEREKLGLEKWKLEQEWAHRKWETEKGYSEQRRRIVGRPLRGWLLQRLRRLVH